MVITELDVGRLQQALDRLFNRPVEEGLDDTPECALGGFRPRAFRSVDIALAIMLLFQVSLLDKDAPMNPLKRKASAWLSWLLACIPLRMFSAVSPSDTRGPLACCATPIRLW